MTTAIEDLEQPNVGWVVVFRADVVAEAKRAADCLTANGFQCEVGREAGIDFVEYTEHFSVEERPSFTVVVEERDAERAERVLADQGFESMVDPAAIRSSPKPIVRYVLFFLLGMFVMSAVYVVLGAFGLW